MLTYFSDADSTVSKEVTVDFKGFEDAKAKIYILDEENDLAFIREEIITAENSSILIKSALYSSYLIKLSKI